MEREANSRTSDIVKELRQLITSEKLKPETIWTQINALLHEDDQVSWNTFYLWIKRKPSWKSQYKGGLKAESALAIQEWITQHTTQKKNKKS